MRPHISGQKDGGTGMLLQCLISISTAYAGYAEALLMHEVGKQAAVATQPDHRLVVLLLQAAR